MSYGAFTLEFFGAIHFHFDLLGLTEISCPNAGKVCAKVFQYSLQLVLK